VWGEKVVQLYRWIVSCVSVYMTIILGTVQEVYPDTFQKLGEFPSSGVREESFVLNWALVPVTKTSFI
jgi:hypothetical protein